MQQIEQLEASIRHDTERLVAMKRMVETGIVEEPEAQVDSVEFIVREKDGSALRYKAVRTGYPLRWLLMYWRDGVLSEPGVLSKGYGWSQVISYVTRTDSLITGYTTYTTEGTYVFIEDEEVEE